jgi:hypothetical protein
LGRVVCSNGTNPFAEFACAVAAAPWEWSANQVFKPWPPTLRRGEPVIPPSLADEPKAWKRAHEAR